MNDTHVSVAGTSSEDGAAYGLTAHLFRKLEPAGSSWEVNDLGEVQLILQKFWEWRYWPRLLHTYNVSARLLLAPCHRPRSPVPPCSRDTQQDMRQLRRH